MRWPRKCNTSHLHWKRWANGCRLSVRFTWSLFLEQFVGPGNILDPRRANHSRPLIRSSWDSETKIEVDQWFRGIRVAAYCLQIRDQLSRSVTPSRANARC